MCLSSLVWVALLGPIPPPGADASLQDLVGRLASPRFVDREQAAQVLEARGREALPALRAARDAADPELRARATGLVEKIETELMIQPTTVQLDFRDRPLPEVARAIGARAGIPVDLDTEGDTRSALARRRVTAIEPKPVTFWTAIDQLCRAGRVRADLGPLSAPTGGMQVGMALSDDDGGRPAPTSNDGPFRARLVSLHYQRDRQLERGARDAPFAEQFHAQLQILAEPRLLVGQAGGVRLTDVVDDKGQSLQPPPQEDGGPIAGLFDRVEFSGGGALHLPIPLRYPESPGKRIVRFRGQVPLIVAERKPNPLVVPLADAVGKSFTSHEVMLTVQSLRANADEGEASLEIRVRPRSDGQAVGAPADRTSPIILELLEHQVEVVDAQGRSLAAFPQEAELQGTEARLSLRLAPTEGVTAPRQLFFYSLTRAHAEMSFDFTDVEMP